MALSALKSFTAQEIAALPKDAAGRKCSSAVPLADPNATVENVRGLMQRDIQQYETINYIYIVDEWSQLVGVLSLKDLYALPPHHRMGEVCKREGLVHVRPDEHQERVAYLALRHNIKAVPVVDSDHRLLGVIPSDVILRILYKEVHEDLLRLVGVRQKNGGSIDNVLTLSVFQSVKHRIPWLLGGLLGGLAVARVIHGFESVLEHNLVLAAFIPLIVYMSDAVGTQMEAFVIRDLAMDRNLNFWKYLCRQFVVVMLMAAIFGVMLAVFGEWMYGNGVAVVLGVSLAAAIASSVLTGLMVPYAFSRFRMDPANASGPTATIIQDFLSILIYFLIAQWMLM